jgi:hypothetical protein
VETFKYTIQDPKNKEATLSMNFDLDDIQEHDTEWIFERFENKYNCDGNCTNESVNHCECEPAFDDWEIVSRELIKPTEFVCSATIEQIQWCINKKIVSPNKTICNRTATCEYKAIRDENVKSSEKVIQEEWDLAWDNLEKLLKEEQAILDTIRNMKK